MDDQRSLRLPAALVTCSTYLQSHDISNSHVPVQRSDDTEEKAQNRIHVYNDNKDLVVAFYEDKIVEVDGNTSMEAVFQQIESALDSKVLASA